VDQRRARARRTGPGSYAIFRVNEVQLVGVIAYNLSHPLRRLVLPVAIED
jgi:hypothetical protein